MIFPMKQLLVMMETHLRLTARIKQLIQEIDGTCRSYFLCNTNPKISEKVKHLQNQLKF